MLFDWVQMVAARSLHCKGVLLPVDLLDNLRDNTFETVKILFLNNLLIIFSICWRFLRGSITPTVGYKLLIFLISLSLLPFLSFFSVKENFCPISLSLSLLHTNGLLELLDFTNITAITYFHVQVVPHWPVGAPQDSLYNYFKWFWVLCVSSVGNLCLQKCLKIFSYTFVFFAQCESGFKVLFFSFVVFLPLDCSDIFVQSQVII